MNEAERKIRLSLVEKLFDCMNIFEYVTIDYRSKYGTVFMVRSNAFN